MCGSNDSKRQVRNDQNVVTSLAPSLNKLIYVSASALCAFMVLWIMVFPSSWLMGSSKRHDDMIHKYLVEPYDGTQIPPGITTKYAGHPAIQFSHILPAALWSVAIPFQVHPGFRKSYKSVHRKIGYAFMISSLLMTVGMFLIIIRKLTYENDYDAEVPPLAAIDQMRTKAAVVAMGIWFAYTSVMAVVKAKAKDFQSHKYYIYRHCGSGLWVAIQRVIILASGPQKDASQMRDLFENAAWIAYVASICVAEVAVFLDKSGGQKKTVKMY